MRIKRTITQFHIRYRKKREKLGNSINPFGEEGERIKIPSRVYLKLTLNTIALQQENYQRQLNRRNKGKFFEINNTYIPI